MVELPSILQNLKMNNYYKYTAYLSGLILFFSLFIETKGVTNEYAIYSSFLGFCGSAFLWFLM